MTYMPRRYLSLLLLAVLPAWAQADWPQWRGAGRDGVAAQGAALAEAWGATGPQKLWQSERLVANDAGGMGSVAIADGKAYVFVNWKTGYAGGREARDVVVCLDALTGGTLWKTAFPGGQVGSGTSSTPCLARGCCYVAGGKRLYCLDAATGVLRWQTEEIGSEISSSPLVVGNVVALCAGVLRGFDAATGAARWQQPAAGSGSNTSPALWTKDGTAYLLTTLGHLCCVEAATGALRWSADDVNCNATPVVVGDMVVTGSPVACYALTPTKATRLWTANISDRGSSPVVYRDHVYAWGRNTFTCLDLATGAVRWQHPCPGEISSPVVADGKVLAVIDGGSRLTMFRADPAGYVGLGDARLLIANCTSPGLWQGRLYLRLHDSVGCFNLSTVPIAVAPRRPENPPDAVPGLRYAYFHNFGGMTVDDLAAATPADNGVTANFDLTPRRMTTTTPSASPASWRCRETGNTPSPCARGTAPSCISAPRWWWTTTARIRPTNSAAPSPCAPARTPSRCCTSNTAAPARWR